MQMSEETDVLVVGAGTAGTQVARAAARAGLRVTVIERSVLGGTCVWRGCVPKKALYTAAQTRREAMEAARMGFAPGPPGLDWTRLMAWRQEVQQAYAGDQAGAFKSLGVGVVDGEARFVSPQEVAAGGRTFTARHIVVSSGSRAVKPRVPGAELADTSDDALRYGEQPGTLAILGGGYIAMEFAGIYAAFGTAVTVVLRGTEILRPFDPEAAAIARRGLEDLGVAFVENAELESIEGERGDLRLTLATPDGHRELRAARVLAAWGREPDVGRLDFAAGGVAVDGRGRPELDEFLRSLSNPRVWVAGDAAGGLELTPVASLEGEAIAAGIVGGEPKAPDLAALPSVCFTVPEVARVGLGEAELAARGRPYQVARGDFEWIAQAIITARRGGLVKLLADETGRLVGAHLAGPHAAELIYAPAVAIRAGVTLPGLQATRAVHPSFAEALNWASFAVETKGA
jgi:glutathione reductase (NADPH)